MDLGIVAAVVMLVGWAVAALVYDGPGWIHGLLTAGVFLLIYRIVVRSTPDAPPDKPAVQPKRARRAER